MRRSILLLTLALVAGACAGGTGSSTTSPPAPATTETTATTTIPPTTTPSTTSTATSSPTAPEQSTTSTTTTPATTTTVAPLPLTELRLRLTEVASGFGQPVFVDAPAGDDRLFIVDQPGAIELVSAGERLGTFLDVRDRVSFGGEQGLLGLAFHPGYPADPRFYVHYTALDGAGIIAEYRVSDDPTRADPASERVLLRVPQPAANHNGGMLAFGPDGHLYIALGDGGGANDRFGHGQNRETVLGAILRVDVDGDPYAIPAANPFADGGGAPEIWAFGLRNPWRFSFDGDLAYIADVGQNAWEEINVVDHRTAGPNFGWPVLEASTCFAAAGCEREGFESPVFEYPHRDGACSVTGGYVYRGATIPELAGAYFFGDFCSGAVTAFRLGGTEISELRDWPDLTAPGLTSFGTDGAGELYLTTTAGSVFRIDRG